MERKQLIIIGSVLGSITVVVLIVLVVFLRIRATSDLVALPLPTAAPSISGEVPGARTPDESAIQRELDDIKNSTYDERLRRLSAEVQQQLAAPPTFPQRPAGGAIPQSNVTTTPAPTPSSTPTPPTPAPSADADGDGLTAEQEANVGTDPNTADTDSDGLTDRQEVETYKTDPLRSDTDSDTFADGAEVQAGYNPLGPGRCARETCIP